MTQVLLCDNGSRQPAATLMLRTIAKQLSELAQCAIAPVSLQHSDAINAALLNDQPAQTLPQYLQHQLQQGENDFIILPLFFGSSRAITSFIPEQQQLLAQRFGEFSVRMADVLYPLPEGDIELVNIIFDNIQQCMRRIQQPVQQVVLVDHGSPVARVTEVRKSIARQLQTLLGDDILLSQAVMERRAGKEYDFNGDLLQDWLIQQAQQGVKGVIVAMMFLLPGRHAGPAGDVNEICQAVMQDYPGFEVSISALVGDSKLLLNMLHHRLQRML